MELPKIDISKLPDHLQPIGVFGSAQHPTRSEGSDDSIIVLMTFIYEIF